MMKWIAEKEPWRAELIQEITLTSGSGIIVAGKNNPIPGLVTHYGYRKFGKNVVCMCRFYPDIVPDKYWEFSRKYIRKIESK